jgi:DNA polymerase-1
VSKANNIFSEDTIAFDIETGSVDDLFSAGPEYPRLNGWCYNSEPVNISVDANDLVADIRRSHGKVIGHNILNFDLIALARHCNLDILDLARKDRILDTKLLAFLADPPLSRTKEGEIERMFSLDNTGLRYLGEGKVKDIVSGKSVLKELAKEFGGFDQIPQDHPDYIEYLRQDVIVTRDLARVLPITDYAIREHKINAIASMISIQGFRVDEDLLEDRIRAGEEKRLEILTSLMGYGLPHPDSTKAPQRTNKGLAAIDAAFQELGITLSRTPTGRPAMGKDVLEAIKESTKNEKAYDLAEAVQGLNGIRTIYGNIQEHLVNGKAHPSINLRQSSGRWSITKPGLTVIGKRDGKVIERAVFIPDDFDQVLISCDLAQVDARACAALSQDTEYLKLFEPGRDLHAEMALRLFGDEGQRERAKASVHGINYGMQYEKLARTTGMTEDESSDVIYNFQKSFPRLAEWQEEVRIEGEATGVLYNGFGRMLRIEPERSFTQSPALMGQSTARDILCEGVLNLWKNGGDDVIKMIRGVIHDECVLSVPIKDVEEIEQLVAKSMSFLWCPEGGQHPVNIIAGLNKRGKTWAACYDK